MFDIYVVGGGINGIGIAVDAAGRGLKVGLCEQGDLASSTSSASSKLIHGGLRYLEHYAFRLVKEALAEREVLLKMAPHIASPLCFRLPHHPQLRPAWMIRAGLFLYDHLSKRNKLPGCQSIKFDASSPLAKQFIKGFEYFDARVDDARLVILNAIKLRELGGEIKTRTRLIAAERTPKKWKLTIENVHSKQQQLIETKILVNAAGPWVHTLLESILKQVSPIGIKLVKGSHIIVPRLHQEEKAYILQGHDKRIIFVLPYEQDFSLIGTTDIEYTGNPTQAICSQDEINYLCNLTNQYFKNKISPKQVIWTYSGVRPLCDDESHSPDAITRDYTIKIDTEHNSAPLLSVFGGKLTTYRKLSEAAINQLTQYFPKASASWTAHMSLPGSENFISLTRHTEQLLHDYPWLEKHQAQRFSRCYGTLAHLFLKNKNSMKSMGEYIGAGLTEAEVRYLIHHEWAQSTEDILWRRSKLGLLLTKYQKEILMKCIKRIQSQI